VNKLEGDWHKRASTTITVSWCLLGRLIKTSSVIYQFPPKGALAYLRAGATRRMKIWLGSPFPLDAAMHAACVWGQRFGGIVPFSCCFEKRVILSEDKKKKAPILGTGCGR